MGMIARLHPDLRLDVDLPDNNAPPIPILRAAKVAQADDLNRIGRLPYHHMSAHWPRRDKIECASLDTYHNQRI